MKAAAAVLLATVLFPFAGFAGTVPTKIGQCVVTKIATIGTRLEGISDSGDQVTYANSVLQVSYAAIKGLKSAKAGDAVKLCLTGIPDDCPPGDTRGKTYRATDLRNGQHWDAADSEHICGGA